MPKKTFFCKRCDYDHERPINSKCVKPIQDSDEEEVVENGTVNQDINVQILSELKNLSGRLSKFESKVNQETPTTSTSRGESAESSVAVNKDVVLPSLHTIKSSVRVQKEVDRRLEELKQLNSQGKYKSQCGGNEVVWCKKRGPVATKFYFEW